MGYDGGGTRRALRQALPVLLATALMVSCSAGPPRDDPATGVGGESLEEHCADGRPSMVDVVAHRRGRTVVVTWALPRIAAEPRTYRLLRRGPRERWDRVAHRRLPAGAARRLLDATSPSGSLRYAVVEIDACGVGPVCSPTGIGLRCAIATVPARRRG
jgi:hypothetical protein